MPRKSSARDRAGRFAYEGLDRVIHEKARLGILASLAAHKDGLLFNDLKEVCSLTDGNLSRHLAALAAAKLVQARRGRRGPRPQTLYSLTAGGRRRFTEYIGVLRRVVADADVEPDIDAGTERGRRGLPPAFSGA